MTYQIIYTKQELDALHPKAIVAVLPDNETYDRVCLARQILPQHDLPAVVICPTGDPMEAARQLWGNHDRET